MQSIMLKNTSTVFCLAIYCFSQLTFIVVLVSENGELKKFVRIDGTVSVQYVSSNVSACFLSCVVFATCKDRAKGCLSAYCNF